MNTEPTSTQFQQYIWHLTTESDNNSNHNAYPLSLRFDEERVSIQQLCNPLMASYTLDQHHIHFSQVASGMRLCPDPELMQYEQHVAKQLPTATTWQLDDDHAKPLLTIDFDKGERWQLHGEPTNELNYGVTPETIFFEVSPNQTNDQLTVRRVYYDSDGLKQRTDNWQTLPIDAIEGYEPQADTQQVVRVLRYSLDTDQYAYELDMIIESRHVKPE